MRRIFLLFVFVFFYVITARAQEHLSLNRACYQSGAVDYDHTAHLTTDGNLFTSWKSAHKPEAWIYVDLGNTCTVSSVVIHWGDAFARNFIIETAVQGPAEKPSGWTEIYQTSNSHGKMSRIRLANLSARYLRILCRQSNRVGFEIKELGVYGKGRVRLSPKPVPPLTADGKQFLTGGNWKLQRKTLVKANPPTISGNNYDDSNWIPATVPGTVLRSYLDIGAIPDPVYADQQLMISESFFTADFWYRNSFRVPTRYKGQRIWLNFDGINWKADIYLNGRQLGNIHGAFIRGRFDITDYVKPDGDNVLAVLVYKNDHPGEVTEQHLNDADPNGGIIGFDSPTFLASIGWNWIPTIRGRNTGIWNDVFLSATNSISIEDPFIKTDLPLPDTSRAAVSVDLVLKNHQNSAVTSTLKGEIGDVRFSKDYLLQPGESKTVHIDHADFPQLLLQDPQLWWPNGYGKPTLHNLNLKVLVNEIVSDQKNIAFGIREYSYTYNDNKLRIGINGVPLIIRGGNWGMSESMLRCDSAGYDLRVRLHRDMNLNLIRNWIGMIGDDEFYEACDRYGIMIWDDFWLANPLDGPDPSDNKMFMANVYDKIKRVRNHASLALWCGRNEGLPPSFLDSAMNRALHALDGSRHYIPGSADGAVTGLGPYDTKDPKWYFLHRGTTLHSEQGIVTVPTREGIEEMMPAEYLWPINDMWGKHDWTQPRVKIYKDDLERSYGKATDLTDFCRKAQMMNMEGPKAMMETWQSNRGPGGIVWMTHPAWPSFICQSYDYYLEPTAAFFALKKGSEPLHILWRADNEKVQIVNSTIHTVSDLTATISLWGMDGRLVFQKNEKRSVRPDEVADVLTMTYPENITPVHFIQLELKDSSGRVLSRNFYWRGSSYQDYRPLANMKEVSVTAIAKSEKRSSQSDVNVTLSNNSSGVALSIRLKVLKSKSGKRVLPVFYEDNYISLVPGEKRTVTISFNNDDLDGEEARLIMEGWNMTEKVIPVAY
ncbi:discoidin domain-containing protein [Nostoc ellipsosporum NOK]|nr:discoidin domain-containing protein [Nostoc ellipsosporum NOK]